MSNKRWLFIMLVVIALTLSGCRDRNAPVFQVEITSEITVQVRESHTTNVDLIVADIFDFNDGDEVHRYGLRASVNPVGGAVELLKLSDRQADPLDGNVSVSLGGTDNISTTLEFFCTEVGEAEIKVEAETLELYDEATLLIHCVDGDESASDETDEDSNEDANGESASACEPFDSNINVGSITEVGQAAVDTGLVPEDVGARAVGQELRRMMEVTGEVCQHDLLALTSGGEITPEMEGAIIIAVLRVQRESE
jgi:hypothetical protein